MARKRRKTEGARAEEGAAPATTGRLRLEPADRVALGIVGGLALVLLWARHDFIPFPPDAYYHLMAAREIVERGAVPLWDDWQFAPGGRPHLYPPLFHLLLAALSLPFGGDVLEAFRVVLALLLPTGLLSAWYLARRFHGPGAGLAALALLGWDPMFAFTSLMGMPAILAGACVTVLLAQFLYRRFVPCVLLAVCVFYIHPGVGPFALLGLLVFSLVRRAHLPFFLVLAGTTLLLALPWYARFWLYRDWLSHPIDLSIYGYFESWQRPWIKLAWLQCINLGLVGLLVGMARRIRVSDDRNLLLLAVAAGCLPLLFSYGGRYYLHVVPLMCVLCAGPLGGWVEEKIRRRALRWSLLPLAPTVVLIGFGTVVRPGPFPMVSGWTLPILLGAGAAGMLDGGARLGYASLDDIQAAADHIRRVTEPDQVIHASGDRDLGVAVAYFADRPVDLGAWEEVSPPDFYEIGMPESDPGGCYVGRDPWAVPSGVPVTQFGSLYVAVRPPPTR